MKLHSMVMISLFVTSIPVAQTSAEEIEGAGTPDFIARFTGTHTIGNSSILQAPNGYLGIGWPTPQFPLHIFSSNTLPPAGEDSPIVLFVQTNASTNSGRCPTCAIIGIESFEGANTGNAIAIHGLILSPTGTGVLGNYQSTTGGGGGGVLGLTNSADFGFSFATGGTVTATTGSAVALYGQTFSHDGWAGYFVNRANGNIMQGVVGQNADVSVFRVDGTGKVFADGGFQSNGADFAESMPVTGDRDKYAAGDLLVIDPTASRRVALAREPYSTRVAGIFSTKPGLLGSNRKVEEGTPENEVPLAVVGIVPCKVTAENGAIRVGDLLVTSSTPGHAMKGSDRSKMLGAVVGKALEPLEKGTGAIQVLVALQ